VRGNACYPARSMPARRCIITYELCFVHTIMMHRQIYKDTTLINRPSVIDMHGYFTKTGHPHQWRGGTQSSYCISPDMVSLELPSKAPICALAGYQPGFDRLQYYAWVHSNFELYFPDGEEQRSQATVYLLHWSYYH
jgi:hypothetical protein